MNYLRHRRVVRPKNIMTSIAFAGSLAMVIAGYEHVNHTALASSKAVTSTGTLTIGQGFNFADTFLPTVATDLYTTNITSSAFDSLLAVDNHFNFIPWLAKSWSWSRDHKTLTMTLQPHANWTDGKPVTSDDVLYAINFLASPDYTDVLQGQDAFAVEPLVGSNTIASGKATSFAATGGFTKINDKTFQLHFAQADAAVLWSDIANIVPLPSHIMKQEPIKNMLDWSFDKRPTVSDGPYKFSKVVGTDAVEMTANSHYWAGKPRIAKLVWRTVNPNVAPGLLANGSIDMQMNGLKPVDVGKLRQLPAVNVVANASLSYYYLGEKLYLPEFKDYHVREAFEYAINRKVMVHGILKGYGHLLNGPVPSISWVTATAKNGLNPYPYNPKKAEQLLSAAGWKVGANGFRIDPYTHKTADLHLAYPIDPTRQAIAIGIQQDFTRIGLHVTLDTPLDLQTFYSKIENDDKGIQMFVAAFSLAVDPDPRGMWQSSDPLNFYRWKDNHNMKLIRATYADAAFDRNVRKQAFLKWELYVNQQLPANFLFQSDDVFAVNRNVHIPAADWNANGPFNIYQWTVSR